MNHRHLSQRSAGLKEVRTKQLPPRLRGPVVQRRGLHHQLTTGLDRKLTLVVAPAGFGKTTLVAW